MHDHPPSGHSQHRWTARSALHMVGAMGDFWSSDLNRAVIDLINPAPGMTLLDVGAGLGPATTEAARRIGSSGRVIAVDPSPAMRGVLRMRRLWQRSRQLIDVRAGSVEELPIEAGSIDAALAINAAHHFDDHALAATELVRVLKPGGRILLVDEDFTNSSHPYHDGGETEGPQPVDALNIAELFRAAGLTATYTDHHPIAGVTATIIRATALPSQPVPEADQGQPHTEGHHEDTH